MGIASVINNLPKLSAALEALKSLKGIAQLDALADVGRGLKNLDKIDDIKVIKVLGSLQPRQLGALLDGLSDTGKIGKVLAKMNPTSVSKALSALDDPAKAANILNKLDDPARAAKILNKMDDPARILDQMSDASRLKLARLGVNTTADVSSLKISRNIHRTLTAVTLTPAALIAAEYTTSGGVSSGMTSLLYSIHDKLKAGGYDFLAEQVKDKGLATLETIGEIADTPRRALINATSEALIHEGKPDAAAGVRIGGTVLHSGFAVSVLRIAHDEDIGNKGDAVIQHIIEDADVTEEQVVSYLEKTPMMIAALPENVQESLYRNLPQLEGKVEQSQRQNPDFYNREFLEGNPAQRMRDAAEMIKSLPDKSVSSMDADEVSNAFNIASSIGDQLNIGFMGKIALAVVGGIGSLVASFAPAVGASIQRFALSLAGADEKFADFKNSMTNGNVVAQFGDRFNIGDNAPELGAKPFAPALA